ncbi:MAG: topoisomerase DNA-binding C4 zinc finger domain-containing protein, partial [Clostridiales bacterium]|nr:topoisomerase DNA-binding C4 zinc finger domain-containing protein [Clostridiales bacterium]
CSGFPECRNTKPIVVATEVKCLACGGNIVQRKSRAGRVFYACDNYPQCKYVAWDLPIAEKCPECGTQLSRKGEKGRTACPNKECPANKKAARPKAAKPAAKMPKTTKTTKTSKTTKTTKPAPTKKPASAAKTKKKTADKENA